MAASLHDSLFLLSKSICSFKKGEKRASRWARTNPAPWCGEGSQHGKSAGTSSLLPGGSVGVVLSWFESVYSIYMYIQSYFNLRCWCRFQTKLTSLVLIFTTSVRIALSTNWSLAEACVIVSLQLDHKTEPITQEKPLGVGQVATFGWGIDTRPGGCWCNGKGGVVVKLDRKRVAGTKENTGTPAKPDVPKVGNHFQVPW